VTDALPILPPPDPARLASRAGSAWGCCSGGQAFLGLHRSECAGLPRPGDARTGRVGRGTVAHAGCRDASFAAFRFRLVLYLLGVCFCCTHPGRIRWPSSCGHRGCAGLSFCCAWLRGENHPGGARLGPRTGLQTARPAKAGRAKQRQMLAGDGPLPPRRSASFWRFVRSLCFFWILRAGGPAPGG